MFTDSISMSLTLTISGNAMKIPGANIKSLRAGIHPYGFNARLSFWISLESGQDDLFAQFIKQDMIEVQLDIEPHFKPKDTDMEPLKLQGLVTDKALLAELTIENVHLKKDPVLYRHYQIDFADPAQVIWRQHYPCDLLVDQTVKDLIEANKATGVDLKYDWEALNDKFAINTLSPGSPEQKVSFYDFIAWYVSTYNGVFTYNGKTKQYALSGTKGQEGKATAMSELEVADLRIDFPAAVRYKDRFMNAVAENSKKSEVTRDTAKEGIRRDYLLREPVAADFEKVSDLESKKQTRPAHEVILHHKRFPLLTYHPDVFVKFEGGLWSDKIFLHGKEYRIKDIFLRMSATDENPDSDHNLAYSAYNLDMRSRLELKDEKALNLPPFKVPCYPIYVEGKIVSEQGKDGEETYQIYKQSQTEIEQYKVKIPLFDDKQVVAPFEPLYSPGHFYFPAYKDERVLVALDFHSARITAFLDWRPGGQLPMDTQGNHILFGKNDESNTSISHVYVDNKPQLNVKRSSSKDTEIIQLHEGTIILQTKDENA